MDSNTSTGTSTGAGTGLRIGIIGTGRMGRALGVQWARGGHAVCFGSRDVDKARRTAAEGGPKARGGDADAAAAFGDVVLYTVRDVRPTALLRQPEALAGKVVIDCNNSAIYGFDAPTPDPAGRPGVQFPVPVPSLAERLAADVPAARVVKAFNTIPAQVIDLGRDRLGPHRVSVFVCGDDPGARATVRPLVEELGFVAVDSGELARAQLVESVADFLRLHMLALGLGPYATLSLAVVPAR